MNSQKTLQSILNVFDSKQKPGLLECGVCASVCEDADSLMAATSSDHHVAVFLEDDIGAVVKVEH